jgi:hypothetical protein
MNKEKSNPRIDLIHDTVVLQLKLVADGFRDAMLIPVSIVAAFIGFLRGGQDCDREFRRVIELGRRSERWINLFGHQPPLGTEHPAGSMDIILSQVEAIVLEQYKKGKSDSETRSAVRKAMRDGAEEPGDQPDGQSEDQPQ